MERGGRGGLGVGQAPQRQTVLTMGATERRGRLVHGHLVVERVPRGQLVDEHPQVRGQIATAPVRPVAEHPDLPEDEMDRGVRHRDRSI